MQLTGGELDLQLPVMLSIRRKHTVPVVSADSLQLRRLDPGEGIISCWLSFLPTTRVRDLKVDIDSTSPSVSRRNANPAHGDATFRGDASNCDVCNIGMSRCFFILDMMSRDTSRWRGDPETSSSWHPPHYFS